MAQVKIDIGGNPYSLSCRDGEEAQLRKIAGIVDVKAQEAIRSLGRSSEARTLLFAALLIADELQEARSLVAEAAEDMKHTHERLAEAEAMAEKSAARADALASRPPPPLPVPDQAPARAIESLADRVEALAARLEKAVAGA